MSEDKYGTHDELKCDECQKILGKIYYSRWIDYNSVYCSDCLTKRERTEND